MAAGEVDVVEEDGVGTFVFGNVFELFVIEIEGAGELDFVAELAGLSPLAEEDGVGTVVFGTVFEFCVIEIEGAGELNFVAELAGLSPLAAMAKVMLKLSLA